MNIEVDKGSIHFVIHGEGKPIIILHPLATDYRSMEAWLEPVFEKNLGYKRIYVDLPAHGQSRINETVKTTDDFLCMLLQLIEELLGKESFSVIGMSFGGYLAQGLLYKLEDQVESIALLVPPTKIKERQVPSRVILQREDEIFNGLDKEIAKAFDILLANQTHMTLSLFLKEFQPGRELANREFLGSEWRTKGYHFSFDPFLKGREYNQNALILTGRQDYICGFKDPFQLVDHFPNSTFITIGNTGHLIQIEQRKKVQAYINEWLKHDKDY